MEMKVRPFTLSDYDQVWQLWQLCHVSLDKRDEKEEVRKKLERDPELFLVAEMNQVIVGAIIGAWDGRNGWLYNNAVDPRMRRLGVGSKLIEELEKRLKEKGALRIYLLVGQHNFEAQDFYQAAGFKIQDDVAMYLELTKES